MIPNSAQLLKLRSRPHATKLYLSIYQPSTVLACRVNDLTIAKGARSITYDTISAGSYLLVQAGMTLLVGSSAGAEDKGRIRVKSATSSVITVAENSHIDWKDNDYLTVVNFYEINAVFPRIIQDPSDATKTIWYKDYDVVYTNQNSVLGSFICMGSHYAGFSSDQVYYSASGTANLLSQALSYFWFFEGGTPTGSNLHTPGYVSYATPGHYTTRLIVSGTATADISYRHVSIYNHPDNLNTSVPIESWEFMDLSGSREQGGYVASIKIFESVPETLLKEGSLVVIFSEDWYGDMATKQSIGGNALNRSSVVFVGYIIKGTIQYNYRDSQVSFDVGSPSEIMKLTDGYSISVQDDHDPATATNDPNIPSSWVAILNMDLKRAIYHFLRWHSTVLRCCDFQFIGIDRALQFFDSDRTSLYDAINTLMRSAFLGSIVSDMQGKIWAERDLYLEPDSFETSFVLDDRDWVEIITMEEQATDITSFIELGGTAYSGSTGTFSALLSNAPGVAPGYRGKLARIEGLALISQAELNTLSGNLLSHHNMKYPSIDIALSGNYRNFDVAPQTKIPLLVSASDTVRGITINGNFGLNRITWIFDSKLQLFTPKISLYEITTGISGDTLVIPNTPPTEGHYGGSFNIPPIIIPPINIPPIPTSVVIGGVTRRVEYVPAQLGYNMDLGTFIEFDWTNGGVPLNATNWTRATARFYSGNNYITGGVKIYAFVKTGIGRDGNVLVAMDASTDVVYNYYKNAEEGVAASVTMPSTTIDLASHAQGAYIIGPTNILTIPVNSSVYLVFYRYGANVLDTNSGIIYVMGFFIEYT